MTDKTFIQLLEDPNFKHARVIYLFDKHGKAQGGVTIAYAPVLHDSKGNPKGLFADVAVSYCSPKDKFCRKTGREVAKGNLLAGISIRLPVYQHGHPVRFLKEVFADYFYEYVS